MNGSYCPDPGLQTTVFAALESYGLEASPTAWSRRPAPARNLGDQFRRIDLGGKVLALVRRSVPVGADDRRLIERLVDSACQRIEDQEQVDRQDVQPPPLTTNPTRRPAPGKPPGSAAPATTNPTRTIRSSRWSAAGKGGRP
jgi:hypothetical protein